MKKICLIIVIMMFSSVYAKENYDIVTLNRCVDGDTVVFNIDGEEVKVRFLAIDTPETVSTKVKEQSFGKEASNFTCDTLTNSKQIVLEYEKSKTDKYGRTLAWVWADGKLVQQQLIEKGYAKVAYIYAKYKYTNSLCNIQNSAVNEKLGLWQNDKEIGYCMAVEVSPDENNIKFSFMENEKKETEKLEKKLEGITDTTESIIDYLDSKKDYLVYAIIIIAAIVAVYKEFKS